MNDVCMLTPRITPNQIRSMPSFSATGPSSGMMMKASSEEIEEEGENEDKRVDENEEADLAAGEGSQQMLDPYVAVHTVEGQREDARTDQDEDDEAESFAVDSVACRIRS